MRQEVPRIILSLLLLLVAFRSSLLVAAAAAAGNDVVVSGVVDSEAIAAAAQKAEALRARLQSHVEAQVNRILSEKNSQAAAGGGGGATHKLELKIDLPPDLAALVNGEGGAALRVHQFGMKREENSLEEVTVTFDSTTVTTTSRGSDGVVEELPASSSSSSSATLCPLGTYSDTGFARGDEECEPCPEGTTTTRLGSDSCQVVTEEDLMAMFYDLMNGDKWGEQHRRGWKSDAPACQWEGVSCDANGEINGIAFPIVGLNENFDRLPNENQ